MKANESIDFSASKRRRGRIVNFDNEVSAFIREALQKARKIKADKPRQVVEILQALAWGLCGERIYIGLGVDEAIAKRDAEIYTRKHVEKLRNSKLGDIYGLSERHIMQIVKNETMRRRKLAGK